MIEICRVGTTRLVVIAGPWAFKFARGAMTSACPFCAAPDWLTWEAPAVRKVMETGATCKECGRSCKAVFADAPGSVSFELVQTGGDDPPVYLVPKMRRV